MTAFCDEDPSRLEGDERNRTRSNKESGASPRRRVSTTNPLEIAGSSSLLPGADSGQLCLLVSLLLLSVQVFCSERIPVMVRGSAIRCSKGRVDGVGTIGPYAVEAKVNAAQNVMQLPPKTNQVIELYGMRSFESFVSFFDNIPVFRPRERKDPIISFDKRFKIISTRFPFGTMGRTEMRTAVAAATINKSCWQPSAEQAKQRSEKQGVRGKALRVVRVVRSPFLI